MAPNNPLPIHGNEKTMNMNHLILTNIQSSPYFKVNLYELKTYHEVIDEIYYRVEHLEPWEKGSRKTAGQTGMCGGVRGVGAGGIVSSAYCLLYKLFTLRLTRKQLNGLITHTDSPYIRALGFMYIRYTQPPADLWDWYSPYLDDEEELDVKAGGGHMMMIGAMVRQWLTKIEWYSTLFPRIPVPVQKALQPKLKAYDAERAKDEEYQPEEVVAEVDPEAVEGDINYGEAERISKLRSTDEPEGRPQRSGGESYDFAREIEREKDRQRKEKEVGSHEREKKSRDREGRDRERDRNGRHRSRSKERDGHRRSRSRERHRHRGRSEEQKEMSQSHEQRDRHHSPPRERKEGKEHRDRQDKKRSKDHKRSKSQERRRSRSRERKDRHKHKHKHRSRSKDRTESRSHRELSPRDRERIRNGERP